MEGVLKLVVEKVVDDKLCRDLNLRFFHKGLFKLYAWFSNDAV